MGSTLSFPPYWAYISIDMRCFDLRQQDYGVGRYFERLGFLPHALLWHATNMDQVHYHALPLDDTPLEYVWLAQRGMAGAQLWTRRQVRELVDIVHGYGIKMYQGIQPGFNYRRRHNTRARWPYEHPEVFIVYRDGTNTAQQTGAINPLARLSDGTWYEDLLCRDVLRYLHDYGMDGLFYGDGGAGLKVRLELGDYSDDMIRQFEEFVNTTVPGTTTRDRADWIWSQQRGAWIRFYVQRWAGFYRKLSSALKSEHKGLATQDPWARSPADAVYDFGFDYRQAAEAGLDFMCLQSHEENWARRWKQGWYVWEPGQVVAASTIGAQAPDMRLLWAIGSANAPENWYAIPDTPTVFERQLLSLPVVTYVDGQGEYRRAFSGFQNIFGIDLTGEEWAWMKERLDFSFGAQIARTLGLTIVWSENVLWEHVRRGQRWQITTPLIRLNLAGVPMHSAVNTDNLGSARSDAYVIVDPLGISDAEVQALARQRRQGATLVTIGSIENARLLEELGLEAMPAQSCTEWATAAAWPSDAGKPSHDRETKAIELTCQATSATPLIVRQDGGPGVIASIKRHDQGGAAIYLAKTDVWPTFPPGSQDSLDAIRAPGFTDMQDLAESLPTALELLMAAIVHWGCGFQVRTSEGQLHAFEAADGSICAMIENIANIFYVRLDVRTSFPAVGFTHYPIKRPSPTGYIVTHSTTERGCQVTVPPDGCVPLKITKQRDGNE